MSKRMTAEQLEAIRKRAEKAFNGPWHLEDRWSGLTSVVGRYPFGDNDAFSVGDCLRKQDAEFIAHSREDIPALLAEVERLREEVETQAFRAIDAENKLAQVVDLIGGDTE